MIEINSFHATLESKYRKLWHILRRIELGVHENGEIMLRGEMQAGAEIALDNVPEPTEIIEGYERWHHGKILALDTYAILFL